MYFRDGAKVMVVGSYAGADLDPAWVHNLRANPAAHIEIGTEQYDVTARELPCAERDAVFDRVVETAPCLGGYQDKTQRVIPIFELKAPATGVEHS